MFSLVVNLSHTPCSRISVRSCKAQNKIKTTRFTHEKKVSDSEAINNSFIQFLKNTEKNKVPTFVLTADKVRKFAISDSCSESNPCKHFCSITLNNGRQKETVLNGFQIYSLLKVIDRKKVYKTYLPNDAKEIKYRGSLRHFSRYENKSLLKRLRGSETLPLAENILERLFKDL